MENNFSVDSQTEIGYDKVNDDSMIVVKMEEQSAINDTTCQHEVLVSDPDDRIGKAIYHGCANPKCGRGFYLQK